mmetsp:Transcript_25291/g.53422  ORF Transcript_25291/g.53422 Transcript_25291/m.53422 type:complete len:525 (+) Transcript_25291:87-1661(+)|eukprot:CAMPEP_0183703256 /NCGR_PEP_ID=MMETSP0737-20130205/1058_1 /TAXON_ID=385413 /ORGANISM="Thalassiosira miniscula, Strain CCMP1093" /LENGTH=524 /DNA_ID=CAMNT_0025929975 /DNA_START=21 /DNA_END=1595 /DNA_ORIENTATION=+
MASIRLITVQIPPGKLGVNIQEGSDGACLVVSKTNPSSPLQVGDIILSFHGASLHSHRHADWVNLIRNSPQNRARTAVVRRRQAVATAAPATPTRTVKVVHATSPTPTPKTVAKGSTVTTTYVKAVPVPSVNNKVQTEVFRGYAAKISGGSGGGSGSGNIGTKPTTVVTSASTNANTGTFKNSAVAQRIQRLENSTKAVTSPGGPREIEAQKKLREMRETRAAGQRGKEDAARQAKDGAERLEKEAERLEAERLEQDRINNERIAAEKKKEKAPAASTTKYSDMSDITEASSEHSASVMVRLLDNALSKADALEKDLKQKTESQKALESEIDEMKCDLGCVKGMLEEEKQLNRVTNGKLATAEERVKALEKEILAKNDLNKTINEECDILRRQLDENKSSEETSHEDLLQIDMATSDHLRNELSMAKEIEESLRRQISQLERDKQIVRRERDEARRQAEGYTTLTTKLQEEVKEQLTAIDSLVELLERQRTEHVKEIADRDDEIASLKKQVAVESTRVKNDWSV